MKLTYTIDLEVDRYEGPNIRKGKVSEAIIQILFDRFAGEETFIARTGKEGDDYTLMDVKGIVVYPHENAQPTDDFPADEAPIVPGDECPTCRITQFKHSAKVQA